MVSVTIEIPEQAEEFFTANGENNVGSALLLAAAIKYYEMGKMSSGAAAEFAGLPKPVFFQRLQEFGVPANYVTEESIHGETRLL